MPNWVLTNVDVSGNGPELQEFLDRFREPDEDIKFKKILPMPEGLSQEACSWPEIGAVYVWLTEHPGELPPAGLLKAKREYKTFAEFCEESKDKFEGANQATQQRMIEKGRRGLDSCYI